MKKRKIVNLIVITFVFFLLTFSFISSASAAVEVEEMRTLDSRTFRNSDGTRTLRAYSGHIHYLDENTGEFEAIDTAIIEGIDGNYEMLKASYQVELSDGLSEEGYPIRFLTWEQSLAFMPWAGIKPQILETDLGGLYDLTGCLASC